MNYFRSKNTKIKKLLNKKTSVAALILVSFFSIFSSYFVQSQGSALPDCKTFAGNPQPGNNCLFYGMPLCQGVPSATYIINPSSVLIGAAPNHRSNCADLSDLPLCSQMDGAFNPMKDCVKECSDPGFNGGTGVRGVDFAVHNRDCVRFCDAPEAGVLTMPGSNCIGRTCHQLPNGVIPQPGINCELKICNLLTPDELNEVKFDDATKQYCDGLNIKCHQFTKAQLRYVKLRAQNQTCNIHNCRVADSCMPNATDDIQKIRDKAAIDPEYLDFYKLYAFFGLEITNESMCNRVSCKPVFYREYRCLPMADANPTTPQLAPDGVCDTETNCCDTDLNCPSGYCKRKIDCNLVRNLSAPECSFSTSNGAVPTVDDTNSWFYRPQPQASALAAGGVLKRMQGSLCYTQGDMESHGWGDDNILFGYFHWDNRSPGKCSTPDLGNRGNGYIYLCGTSGLLYNMPDEVRTAFYKGYASSVYTEGGGTHSIQVCLRFNNTMDPQRSCGSRECMISCGFDICTQHCGFDKCETLTIDDTNPRECMMSDSLVTRNSDNGCMQKIGGGLDSYLRLRAVKYGRYMCGFLDFKGTLAYNGNYFNGSEKLSDGTCISGDNVDGVCSGAKNTNDNQGFADVWRTVMKVHYIDNNRLSGPRGYLDRDGRLFKEQECPKVSYRVITPKHYNLANNSNSQNLFSPPMYIMNMRVRKDGPISNPTSGNGLGVTDFHYPELEVRFGTTTRKLSLGINYTGYEDEGAADPNSFTTISTTLDGFNYTAEIFVRKEQTNDSGAFNPNFCLYRRIQDINGAYIAPLRIGCAPRRLPEINNAAESMMNPLIDFRRVLVSPHALTTFDSAKMSFRYLSSSSSTSSTCGSNGASCTTEALFENPIQEVPNCYDNVESKKICVQREECSRLNVECVQNEIAMNNAMNANLPVNSFLTVRRNCNEILLPLCNSKKGLTSAQVTSVIDYDYNAPPVDPNLYGWHNEMCITKGFETKLKNVLAYQINGAMGKCVIDNASPYLTDGNPATNCDNGGKAPNCLCAESEEGVELAAGLEDRLETPREAGLCIDIPLPQTCAAIDYNQSQNNDVTDLEYISTSVGNNSYGTSVTDINGKVHISHRYRSEGKAAPNPILLRGHAEFPTTIFGINDVIGQCKGFWTYKKSDGGNNLTPKLNCINNNGNAVWESAARDACVRFKCDEIYTAGPDATGTYQGTYGVLETGENKGLSHGFALWTAFTKTNDFLETATANSCITGFKAVGATALKGTVAVSGQSARNAALYQEITGYSGGNLPTRQCNQIGQWQETTNNCQRITCSAINPPTPSGVSDSAAWELWRNSGGATFPSVNASRSASGVQAESIATGTCNQSLGFFQSPGGNNPTRKCDHLGNWLPVEDPCVTTCDAVTTIADADNFNNGFATWDRITSVFDPVNGAPGNFLGCIPGYVTNPYPPAVDIRGNPLAANIANNITSRPAENPKRLCTVGAPNNLGVTSNVWTAVVNGCINQCPGYSADPRVGVGRTIHPTTGGNVNFDWPSTDLGADAYISNFDNPANFDASYFEKPAGQARSINNTYYLVKRHCNANGKWSDPEPMCATNNGQIGNARYDSNPLTTGYNDSIAVGGAQSIAGNCITNFWKSNFDQNPAPLRACLYENSNNYIDQVYLGLINGTADCEQRRCPARAPYLGTRAKISAIAYNDSRTTQGSRVKATCLNNEPNSLNPTSTNPIDYTYTSVAAEDMSPYVECLNNGVWSTIQKEENCKKGCNAPIWGTGSIDVSDCGGGPNTYIYGNAHTLQHGQVLTYYATDSCRSWNILYLRAESCNDGDYKTNEWYLGEFWGESVEQRTRCVASYTLSNTFSGPQQCYVAIDRSNTPIRSSDTYVDKYGATYGTNTIFGGYVW